MEYKIEGLNKKQVALLDIMWYLDDLEQVTKFINSLPTRDRAEAHSLMILLTHEALEEMMPLHEMTGFIDAQTVIERVRSA